MAKYKVQVGSFCTRLVQRTITVYAKNEAEAEMKAIDKYEDMEKDISASVDSGEPIIDYIDRVD